MLSGEVVEEGELGENFLLYPLSHSQTSKGFSLKFPRKRGFSGFL